MQKELKIVAIDTSTAVMAGATYGDHVVLQTVKTEAERNHSIHIMTNIEKLIKESEWSVDDVTHYVVGIGPGSYTGVRIAVSAVKTLAWTTKKAIVSVSSLEGLAYSALVEQTVEADKRLLVVPIMDARRGQVYTCMFKCESNGEIWLREHDDHIILMNNWIEKLAAVATSYDEIIIVGDVHLHEQSINTLAEQLSIPVKGLALTMNGAALAELGARAIEQNQGIYKDDQVHRLAPNYAQLTEAEVKQNAKEKGAERNG